MTKSCIAPDIQSIYLVGTGGTGSYFAQGMAKLIAGYGLNIEVTFIDPDIVEEKNIHRQNFLPFEIGESKAQALAFRLNQQYGLQINAAVTKGEDFMGRSRTYRGLLVTCVDKIAPRKALSKYSLPWLDMGNDVDFGQAIYGNLYSAKECDRIVKNWDKVPAIKGLPNPSIKVGLSKLRDKKTVRASCADSPFDEQSCFVNELSAQAGLTILHQILVKGEITTPAIYFDTAKGRMNPAKITPAYFDK